MFGLSNLVTIWVFAGLGVMVILFLMSGMARLYRKAGPHEALIVYGLGGTRVVQGHGTRRRSVAQRHEDAVVADHEPQAGLAARNGLVGKAIFQRLEHGAEQHVVETHGHGLGRLIDV